MRMLVEGTPQYEGPATTRSPDPYEELGEKEVHFCNENNYGTNTKRSTNQTSRKLSIQNLTK